MSVRQNSQNIPNITFSQALEGGLTHLDWLVGPTTDPCGQEVVLVSHSAMPERVRELRTTGTCGLCSDGLSRSADLQSCLESRLQAALDGIGSLEYALTWKRWDMPSGVPICALRASVRRTSGSGCGGWPTPCQQDGLHGGPNQGTDYRETRLLTGWATPTARDYRSESATEELNQKRLDHPRGKPLNWQCAEMGNNAGYLLNPLFSLWLQGYPAEWAYSVVPEMQSIPG